MSSSNNNNNNNNNNSNNDNNGSSSKSGGGDRKGGDPNVQASYAAATVWNNREDYRRSVADQELTAPNTDWQRVCRSVGTFILNEDLHEVRNGAALEGYRIAQTKPFEDFFLLLGGQVGDYKFGKDQRVGESTAYYIDHNLIATAGHVPLTYRELGPDQWTVIFGLTDEYCRAVNQAVLPPGRVFSVDRTLFRQLGGPEDDRYDWAIMQIRPKHADQVPLYPPPLRIMPPRMSYIPLAGTRDIFAAGHPWGLSLKLADPTTINQQRSLHAHTAEGSALEHTLKHNLVNHPGNSGGPLFLRQAGTDPIVIGTTVSNGDSSKLQGLRSVGFHKDEATYAALMDVPSLSIAEIKKWNTIVRTDVWYNLIESEARITIMLQVIPAVKARVILQIWLHIFDPATRRTERVKFDTVHDDILDRSPKIKITKTFSTITKPMRPADPPRVPPPRPCNITSIETEFVAASSSVTQSPQPVEGHFKFLTLMISGKEGQATPNSDVVIFRHVDRNANAITPMPPVVSVTNRAPAREDEQGAEVVH